MKQKIKNIALLIAVVLMIAGGMIGTKYIQSRTQTTKGKDHLSAGTVQTEQSQEQTEYQKSNETEKQTESADIKEKEKPVEVSTEESAERSDPAKEEEQSDKKTKKSNQTDQAKKKKQSQTDKEKNTATLTIRCDSILEHMDQCDPAKKKYVPKDGYILKETTVTFAEGETVFDVLKRECKQRKIPLEYSWTPVYNNYYIEGIHHLYEFDCGYESGWTYRVDGVFPNYGCFEYHLKGGESIVWEYTCQNQETGDESR